MTRHKHLKDTIAVRQAARSLTYQQARREILEQLKVLEEFEHLPIVWDIAQRGWGDFPSVVAHRAALGAVELGLRDTHILAGASARDRWRTIDGHIDLDWRGGPYAYEVVRALISLAEDPDVGLVDPGELRPGVSRWGELDAVWIDGVRVRFRPYEPVGANVSSQRAWDAIFGRMRSSRARNEHAGRATECGGEPGDVAG